MTTNQQTTNNRKAKDTYSVVKGNGQNALLVVATFQTKKEAHQTGMRLRSSDPDIFVFPTSMLPQIAKISWMN